ncbi:mechanosensitive ion channel family protein [Thalassoroseus pseudoceratinae]|uniref:mechanosensitive ion channel family protein n=1 Tax=Thalassoroseus pseudoceratinae TaxID=2713176 RepID=UPI00141F782B|nr:mechanosensitive ion channel domain-containing protein [Thalassoroseus pseudoceratinae]
MLFAATEENTPQDWQSQFQDFLPEIISSAVILAVTWLIVLVIVRIVRRVLESQNADVSVIDFIVKMTKGVIWSCAIITVLGTLGIDVAALVGGLGLTGFALGFALKDIVSNVLSGMLLLIYQPFERQDRIKVSGWEGVVTDIDLRYTTIETSNGLVLIPNSNLFTTPVELLNVQPKTATDSK